MSDFNRTDSSVSEALKNNQQFWINKIQQSQSVEELEVWKEKVEEASILLMKEAHALSAENDESLSIDLHDASQELMNKSEEAYNKRINDVPASATVTKDALWPTGGLGLSGWGVATLFIQPVPVANIVLGTATLAYAGWEWIRRAKKLSSDMESNQSLDAKEQSGIRLGGASIGVAMGVLGVLEIAGVFFPPALVLPLAATAIGPVAIDAFYWVKNYLDTNKAIKVAKQEGNQQLEVLDNTSSQFTRKESPHPDLNSVLKNNKLAPELPHLLYHPLTAKKEKEPKVIDLTSVTDIEELEEMPSESPIRG